MLAPAQCKRGAVVGLVLQVNCFCCSVLQCVAVCCKVLQCVAVCRSVNHSASLRSSSEILYKPTERQVDQKKTPPLAGFLCWLVSKSQTRRKRTTPEEKFPYSIKSGGCSSGEVLFLRVIGLETTQQSKPPRGGGGGVQSRYSTPVYPSTGVEFPPLRSFFVGFTCLHMYHKARGREEVVGGRRRMQRGFGKGGRVGWGGAGREGWVGGKGMGGE